MKINNTDETLKSIYGETSKKNEKTDDNQFAEILKKTLSPTDESKPVHPNHQILSSTPLPDIQPLKALGTDKSTIVERVHNFLNVGWYHQINHPNWDNTIHAPAGFDFLRCLNQAGLEMGPNITVSIVQDDR